MLERKCVSGMIIACVKITKKWTSNSRVDTNVAWQTIMENQNSISHLLTHLRRVDSSTTTHWTGLFPKAGCLVTFNYYIVLCFIEIPVVNANNVDPDKMPIFCGVWSGSALFANYPFGALQIKMG